jgi:hypothetical protein
MNYNQAETTPHITSHVSPHAERTYTAQEIADQHSVKAVTVRTRWFDWLTKVAPEQLLKNDKSYTELANTLFAEFALVDQRERHAWVADAKTRYSAEWGSVGIVDCEVMPVEVCSTLAILQNNNSSMQQQFDVGLAEIEQFIEQLNTTDANISQAEVQSWAAAGAQKAVMQFKTEEVVKAQTLHTLRQKRMQGGQI